jgi:predicted nucleotidyltransferase
MTFDWKLLYTGNLTWLQSHTLYLTKHGSQAYGTSLPTSDLDIRGICIAPIEYYLGFSKTFEQVVQNEPVDLTVFELRKFMSLATDANPNALEIIFTDPSDYLLVHPIMGRMFDSRHLFLSKKIKHTFSGYARSQMKRIIGHYRWLKNPPKAPPTRAEFELPERTVIPADQLAAAQAAIQKQIDQWSWHEMEHLEPSLRQAMQDEFTRRLLEITQWSWEETDEKVWHAASQAVGLDTNFIRLLDLERRYTAKLREWQNFQTWKKTRNPARAELEAKWGYDCYSEDTEFLTDKGWKLFDEIGSEELLATVFVRRGVDSNVDMSHRPFLGVEYQRHTDRFDAVYNGPMYRVEGHHLDCFVTANHRMLFQKTERVSGAQSAWELDEVSALPDTFTVLVTPTPKKTTYSNKAIFDGLPIEVPAYLSLMGWYLSDGCALFTEDNRVKSVRISQEPGGKLSWHMARWHGDHQQVACSSLYEYERGPNSYNPLPHRERILEVRHPEIAARMVGECGHTKLKRIPRYAFQLGRTLMERLLLGLLRGDGTKREHKTKEGSHIYYSSSRELASDVQELGLLSGWESALWGPYPTTDADGRECLMYQVHLRRLGNRANTRRLIRSSNVSKIEVCGQRVVCFTVPNGTLVTRRNGKVAIHGNCKHALHLVRLSRMCREILTTGQVLVRRPDAQELLEIRNGAWTYEQLVEYSDRQDAELEELAKTSTLPKQPNREKLDQLCVELLETFLTGDIV